MSELMGVSPSAAPDVEHSRDHAAAARGDGAPVELVEPAWLDHMALIDPAAPHWPGVHAWLERTLPV